MFEYAAPRFERITTKLTFSLAVAGRGPWRRPQSRVPRNSYEAQPSCQCGSVVAQEYGPLFTSNFPTPQPPPPERMSTLTRICASR